MIKIGNNIITTGLRGKLGDLLNFRQRAGKTFVSKVPRKSTTEPSQAERSHQQRFRKAILYACTSGLLWETVFKLKSKKKEQLFLAAPLNVIISGI